MPGAVCVIFQVDLFFYSAAPFDIYMTPNDSSSTGGDREEEREAVRDWK